MRYVFVFLLAILTGVSYAQSENAKQSSCNEIDGLIIQNKYFDYRPKDDIKVDDVIARQNADKAKLKAIPKNYTGFVIICVNGKVKSLMEYKNGKPDGLAKGYYQNGQLRAEG